MATPTLFPAVAEDVVNYLFGKYFSDAQISCIIQLNGRVDETIFEQAVWLSLEVEPILRCRFIENNQLPVWQLQNHIAKAELFSVIETNDVDSELQKFIGSHYDFTKDCQIKVRIFRANKDMKDTVCVKIHHACSDGAGLKQYLNLLTSIYTQLSEGLPYEARSKTSFSRGQDQIFSIVDVINAAKDLMKTGLDPQPQPSVKFPCQAAKQNEQAFVIGKIHSVKQITNYARSREVTMNDILLAAFVRTLSKIAEIQNNQVSLYFTIDLRRYLADLPSERICNLSVMQNLTLRHDPTVSFEETLKLLSMETKRIKNNYPGLKSAYLMELAHGKMSYKDADLHFQQRRQQVSGNGLTIPTLSNIGIITDEIVKFGLLETQECCPVGPAAFPPDFDLIAST
jgi:NRPS condensation-like uncharacterized protein